METIYRKVAVSERLPKEKGSYTVQRKEATETYHEMYWYDGSPLNVSFWSAYIDYWLEEIPDFVSETIENSIQMLSQLQKDKEELIEMLEKCKPLISKITRKGKILPSEIESLIQKHKQ